MAQGGVAHPPSSVEITFDVETKIVTAVIKHAVKDAEKHYIEKVDVWLNKKEIITHHISRQDDAVQQTVSYLIPDAQLGDTISVEGYCNFVGKLKKKIEIAEKPADEKSTDTLPE